MLEARERKQEGTLRENRRKATLLLWFFALVVLVGIGAFAWHNRDLIQQVLRESKEEPKSAPPVKPEMFTGEDVKLAKDVYQFLDPASKLPATPASPKKENEGAK